MEGKPMSEIRKALVIISCLFLVAACTAYADERAVEPFSKLHVQNGIDVYLTQSDHESLRVEARDPENIVTQVDNGELRISRKSRGGFFFSGGGRVYLDFVRLSAIEASGGSDIRGRNQLKLDDLAVRASGGSDLALEVQAKRLDLRLSGGSDAKLRGSADALAIRASGGSDTSASALKTGRATLALSGGSDARVNVAEAIEIHASGGSDVRVTGKPKQRTVSNDRSSDVHWR
jgi:hypothetical protein